LPYSERLKILNEVLPDDLRHWKEMPTWSAKTMREFMEAIQNAQFWPHSEGAMVKTFGSKYVLERTSEWAKLKNMKTVDYIILDVHEAKDKKTGRPLGVFYFTVGVSVPKERLNEFKANKLQELAGKHYLKVGKTFNWAEPLKVGSIIEVATVRIREFEDEKGKKWFTHMFPVILRTRPDRKEPDDVSFLEQLEEIGTAPMVKTVFVKLPDCPYYKNGNICPLYWKYEHPWEVEKVSHLQFERLRWPITCGFAYIMKCYYVKPEYYEFSEARP